METEEDSNSMWLLKSLGSAFQWEIRVLYFGIIAGPMYIIHPPTGWAFLFVTFLLVAATDLLFSVIATKIFLRPILEILRPIEKGDGSIKALEGYKNLNKTKWFTLIGSSLAVFSSTILCTVFGVGGILCGVWLCE
jgi:hypothetical protein